MEKKSKMRKEMIDVKAIVVMIAIGVLLFFEGSCHSESHEDIVESAFWPYKELQQKLEKEFDRLDFAKTRGLILDVRDNAGGNSKAGDFILSYLIDKPFKARLFKARKKGFLKVLPNIFAKTGVRLSSLGKEWFTKENRIKPYSKKHFSGPVTVLINRHTASAAEDFAAAFKENKRALLVGETTSGGTGNGVWSILPGYGRLRVTVNLGAYVNGDLWHSVGIKPDVKVQKQRRDIIHHHDPVIEKSIEIIKYLQETEHLDFNSPEFTDVMSELLTHDMSLETKLEKLYYFTRDSLPFASDASLYASQVLKKKKALCYTKAMVYVSFCRRLGVPAKLAEEHFIMKANNRKHIHGIAQLFYNGKWIYVDTVSNRDALGFWAVDESDPFKAPEFSLESNVIVSDEYYQDLSFKDYETNDVPKKWLKQMQKFLNTGEW